MIGMLVALAAAAAAPAPSAPTAGFNLRESIRSDYASHLKALFIGLHEHPELSYKESRTAGIMARELRAAGARVVEHVGGTGVVGVLENGPGPVIMIRAEMDALPLEEKSGVPYSSHVQQRDIDGMQTYVMHACGHDAHMAALIGTAHQLERLRNNWQGTVVFVAQPAEERLGGAKAMLADGLYSRFPKPSIALALHSDSSMPTWTMSAAEGLQFSSSDALNITIRGIGAHGASPQRGKDPVYIGSELVVALQSIITREISPLEPAIITVGAFHAGTKGNIIPDHADLQLTVRANDEPTRAHLLAAIPRVAAGIARANGIPEDLLPSVAHTEATPTTINDVPLAHDLNEYLSRQLSDGAVVPYNQVSMGAEDFAYFVQPESGVRGYYFVVGATPLEDIQAAEHGGSPPTPHHSAIFKLEPEGTIRFGTEAMTSAVLHLMPRPSSH